jgi:hypothetical protein
MLLYYVRAVDNTMLSTIGSLDSEQANSTKNTMCKIVQLLNYCVYHDLGPKPDNTAKHGDIAPDIPANGPFTVISHILGVIVSSAAEAKPCSVYGQRRVGLPPHHLCWYLQ